MTMTTKSNVLIIGGSGNLGVPLVDAFVQRRKLFQKIAILCRDQDHGRNVQGREKQSLQLLYGSFLDSSVYKGTRL